METVIGVIPNVTMFTGITNEIYNLVLTEKRMVVVLAVTRAGAAAAKSAGPFLGWFVSIFAWPIGNALGRKAVDATVDSKVDALEKPDVDLDSALNSNRKNFAVPYAGVRQVTVGKGSPDYYIEILVETETDIYRFYPMRLNWKRGRDEGVYEKYIGLLREAIPGQKLKYSF